MLANHYFIVTMVLTWLFNWSTPASAQTTSTWVGGAGDWTPCPQQGGNALWNTCPIYPDGNYNAVIAGGPVTLSQVNGDDEAVVNLTIDSGDTLSFLGGSLHVTGSIVNDGSMAISTGGFLSIDGSSVTISGTGSVSLQSPTAAISPPSGFNNTFVNQQLISGQGVINGATLTNQGTITASGGTLQLWPNTVTGLTNTGTLQAASGATLYFSGDLSTPFNNTNGTIKAFSGGTVTLYGGTYTGGKLITSGTGTFQTVDGAITPTLNDLSAAADFVVPSGGSVAFAGAITNTGTFNVTQGVVYVSGNAKLQGAGTITMSDVCCNILVGLTGAGSALINESTIRGAGSIGSAGLTITNQKLINAAALTNHLILAGDPLINNATLEASGGGTLEIRSLVDNTGGSIQALTGSVVLVNSGTIQGGTLKTSGTGVFQSTGGTLDGTTNITTNTGTFQVNGGSLALAGTVKNNGTISLTDSSLEINSAATLEGKGTMTFSSGAFMYGSGTLTNESTIEGSGNLGDSGTNLVNEGTLIANQPATLYIDPGTSFSNPGALVVNAGSTLQATSGFQNLSNGTLSGGKYQIAGTLEIGGDIRTNAAALTLTGPSAQILDPNNNALKHFASNTSKGVLSLTLGKNLAIAGSFSSAGSVTIDSTSGLSVGGSFTQTGGTTTIDGTLTAPSGLILQQGAIFGQGKITAGLSSTGSGVVTAGDSATSPGILSVAGYSQGANGVLDLAIGGPSVGTQYSQLDVTGGAGLSGTLNIGLIDSFIPAVGSTFTILTGSAVTGQFATVNGLSINSGEHFEINYNTTSVTLQVVSGT